MESGGRVGKGRRRGVKGKMLRCNQTIIKLLSYPHCGVCIYTQIG